MLNHCQSAAVHNPAVGADGVVRPDHAVGQDGVVADDLGAGRRTTDVPGTAALLVDDAGRHLPHPRDAHKPTRCPGHWAFPGGSAEPGEACDQAVAREPREETGPVVPHRRTVRARAEHVFAHVKTWTVPRDRRLRGTVSATPCSASPARASSRSAEGTGETGPTGLEEIICGAVLRRAAERRPPGPSAVGRLRSARLSRISPGPGPGGRCR
ncbi:NUDIX domain-containing protein [Streptomyces kebangsaanensis]|uniref:NUDIX domain-containing protein n=1 Tax=Streptomyces kebangsaanensis TaxID=864058 RepID=UPI003899EA82